MPLIPFDPPTTPAPAAPTPFAPNTTGVTATPAPAREVITAITGGGSQALDGQLVSLWQLGEAVFVLGETVTLWQLQAGTQATDTNAGFVRPADFDATLNARVFVRLVLAGVGSGGGGGGAVSSVAGRAGDVVLTKGDVGLANVDNTSDAAKPVSTAQAAALALKANASSLGAHTGDTANPHAVTKAQVGLGNVTNDAQVKRTEMGAASGVATLGADGKLTAAQLPSLAVVDYLGRVASQSAMLAKSQAEQGDWLVRNDTGSVWIMTGSNPASLSSWTQLEYPVAPVTSVAGRTGDIILAKADVGLGNVDNTSDAAKPVSTAQAAAIATKLDASQKGAVSGVAPLDGAGKLLASNLPPISYEVGFGFESSSALTDGLQARRVVNVPGTIVGWTLLGDVSGSCVVTLKKATPSGGVVGSFATITASTPPTVSGAQFSASNTLTGWTPALGAGDVLSAVITGDAINIKALTLVLTIQR